MTAPELRSCAEELLYLLGANGVDVLFLNPGTDSAPVQEAAAGLSARGVPFPRLVPSSFESVALAAAHGYWQVTRRPQAVWVHVDAGTQNLGAMVHNVLRDRAGVVVLAGKTPYGEDPLEGGRDNPIHWQQDVPDQAGIVRPYAKWTYELVRPADTARVVGRAVQVAGGGIPGLAYLTISRDVLMEPAGPPSLRRTGGWARPSPPAAAPEVLARVVELLAGAERPLIVTTRLGRTPGASEALARLAELAAIPVVGRPDAVNLPSGHPMACRDPGQAAELLSSADVVLVVEADVPWLPSGARPPDSATVVVIDPDPLRANMPLWTFASDIAVTADGGTALRQLADALEAGGPGPDRGPAPVLRPPRAGGQVDEVLLALNDVLSPDDLVLDETVTNMDAVARLLDRRQPGTLLSSGAPGLGWSLGASVGVKLAAPQRRVVTVVGDGSFMFGVPTSAFCLAAEAEAPFMAVVLNNNGYRASRMPVLELFPGGVSDRAGQVVGTRFRRPPSPADVARACGGWGEAVDDLAGLRDVLAAGLKAVDAGSVAVVDVKIDQD